MPLAWRAMVLNVLRFDPLDRDDSADDTREVLRYAPSLRGSSLAVARCEAAATMLAWHKDLQPRQREALRLAVESVVAQARRLGAA
ncbi:MAG: hypothetical protein KGN36_07745, partial [Acidobacteriota bacterium]|nr:hypothetical protein [Acidobacteriota bacterium]